MIKPNFLFIGPDKSGSTWLYRILSQHPECHVPTCKDIYFFDRYYHRGIDWYLSFFRSAPFGIKAVGEICHDYLFSSVAAQRIARHLPDVKLMVSLRNPVERTFSHYLYMIRSGRTREPFEVALDRFPELINNSMYHCYLSEYFHRFSRSQIKALFFEDLKYDPESFARTCFDLLGLSHFDNLDYRKRVLPASRPRSFFLARSAKLGANLAREMGLETLVGVIKGSSIAQSLYKPYGPGDRPRMEPETKHKLEEVFLPDILRLEDLLAVDLSHWLPRRKRNHH